MFIIYIYIYIHTHVLLIHILFFFCMLFFRTDAAQGPWLEIRPTACAFCRRTCAWRITRQRKDVALGDGCATRSKAHQMMRCCCRCCCRLLPEARPAPPSRSWARRSTPSPVCATCTFINRGTCAWCCSPWSPSVEAPCRLDPRRRAVVDSWARRSWA